MTEQTCLVARQDLTPSTSLNPAPLHSQPELCAHALEDAARNASYHVVNTFGASLEPLLKECHAPLPLPQVSMAEVARLLQGMLQCKE